MHVCVSLANKTIFTAIKLSVCRFACPSVYTFFKLSIVANVVRKVQFVAASVSVVATTTVTQTH